MPVLVRATRAARLALDLVLISLILLVLAALVIARGIPLATGGTTFVVGGGSMEPAIPVGAAVVARPVSPSELAVGDVVSLQVGADRAVFTHRITRLVERDGGLWIATKGDANTDPDPSILPMSAVIGRVELTIPLAGYLVTLLGSFAGVAFLVSLGLVSLVGAWLLEAAEHDLASAVRRRAVVGASAAVAGVAALAGDASPGSGLAG